MAFLFLYERLYNKKAQKLLLLRNFTEKIYRYGQK